MKINIKNTLFVILIGGAILWNVGYAYNRFYIEKDFTISQHISCDPEVENCFVWQCDPAYEECSENPEENVDYYKIIDKSAANIENCSNIDECEEPTCEADEADCTISLCSPEAAELEEAVCSDDMEQSEVEEEGESEEEAEETSPESLEETSE